MKKTLLGLALIVTAVSGFAQGQFLMTSGSHTLWNWTNSLSPVFTYNGGQLDTAFLVGSSTAGSPLVDAIATRTLTNGTTVNISTAWSDILNDPNYTLATNAATGLLAVGTNTTVGFTTYNGGGAFAVTNTVAGNYDVYVIAWSAAYATPALAAAAGVPVGWSNEFTYAAQALGGTPASSLQVSGMLPFGIALPAATPEPSTIALAGLGVSALVAFRRRNSSK